MSLYTVPELIQRLEAMDFCDADLSDAQVVYEAAEALKRFYPVHPDQTGKTREPPHCPTCDCGLHP